MLLCWLSTNGCSLILFYFILLAHQSTKGARSRIPIWAELRRLKVSNFSDGGLFSVKFYAIHVSRFPCFPLEWIWTSEVPNTPTHCSLSLSSSGKIFSFSGGSSAWDDNWNWTILIDIPVRREISVLPLHLHENPLNLAYLLCQPQQQQNSTKEMNVRGSF